MGGGLTGRIVQKLLGPEAAAQTVERVGARPRRARCMRRRRSPHALAAACRSQRTA
jgi:hypothetical protein